jgi:hypothetical protein
MTRFALRLATLTTTTLALMLGGSVADIVITTLGAL